MAVHLALAVPLAWALPLWIDEVYSFETVHETVHATWEAALGFARQAPGYFVLLWAWQNLFGDAVFVARIPSVLATAATVALMPAIARRYLPGLPAAGPLLAFLFAVNPIVIAVAAEVRLYAIWLLMFAVLLITFFDAFLSARGSRRAGVAWVLTAIVGMYTQYFSAAFLLGQWLVLVGARRWRDARLATVGGGVVLLAFLPLAAVVLAQVGAVEAATRGQAPNDLGTAVAQVLATAVGLALPLESIVRRAAFLYPSLGLSPDAAFVANLVVLALALTVAWAVRRRVPVAWGVIAAVTVLLAVQVAFFVAIRVALTPDYATSRHATGMLLPACLLAAGFVAAAWHGWGSRLPALLAVGAIGVLNGAVLWFTFSPLAKVGDFARVADHLRSQVAPGRLVIVHPSFAKSVLDRYDTGGAILRAVPRDEEFVRYDLGAFVVRSMPEIEAIVRGAGFAGRELWLVTHDSCRYHGVDFGCQVVEQWAASGYVVMDDRQFHASRVRHLRPASRDAAAAPPE